MVKGRPAKHADVLGLARRCLEEGRYRDTRHATKRREEREITVMEVRYVLLNGYREPSKDEYKEEYKAWNYAVRGKTVDGRPLRIAISFEEEQLLTITAIDLGA